MFAQPSEQETASTAPRRARGCGLLFAVWILIAASGCRCLKPECVPVSGRGSCPPVPLTSLPLTPSSGNLPVVFPGPQSSRTWQTVVESHDGMVRGLTLGRCRELAAGASPATLILEHEAARSSWTRNGSDSVAEIVRMQAVQSRNDYVAESLTAWFKLLRIGLQHDVLVESALQLVETRGTVDRLRENGLAMDVDLGIFDRQKNLLDDHQAVLASGQAGLSEAIEGLLRIQPDPAHPLATDPEGLENWRIEEIPALEQAVDVAYANRQDLAVLERIAESADVNMLEIARNSLSGVHPLMAIAVSRNLPGGLLGNCRIRQEQEQELADRRKQVCGLAASLKSRIRTETAEAIHAIGRHEAGIRLRQESLASVDRSLQLLEAASTVRPVELQEKTGLQEGRLELETELVEQWIERELAWVRLFRSQGLLAGAGE